MAKYNSGSKYNYGNTEFGAKYNSAPFYNTIFIRDAIKARDTEKITAYIEVGDSFFVSEAVVRTAKPFLYVSGYGRLEPIGLLLDFSESKFDVLPSVRETIETVAGKDGEIVFDTRYEARLFEFVGRSNDDLSVHEKVSFKRLIASILNRIKKQAMPIMTYDSPAMYYVKYTEGMDMENYPGWVAPSFTLKASNPFGYSGWEYTHAGNGTIFNRGNMPADFILKIVGPATGPISMTLNGKAMSYSQDIAAGHEVIINSENETVRVVNTAGAVANGFGYFSGTFPKLLEGANDLVAPGNVTIVWRDKYI